MFTVTPDFVTGYLKLAGSSDPDVLAARKHELVQKQQPMKLGSMVFIIVGSIATITIILAPIGILFLAPAGYVHWKARTNLKIIEASYQDYISRLPASASS